MKALLVSGWLAVVALGCQPGLCSDEEVEAFKAAIPDNPNFLVWVEDSERPQCSPTWATSATSKAELDELLGPALSVDECGSWFLYVLPGTPAALPTQSFALDNARLSASQLGLDLRIADQIDFFRMDLGSCQTEERNLVVADLAVQRLGRLTLEQ